MKKLQEIKDEVAIEHGYDSFEQLDDQNTFSYDHETPFILDEVAKRYAEEALKEAAIALEEIVNPIKFMRERLKEGEKLEGTYAVILSQDHNYLKSIAQKALDTINSTK